MREIKFRAWDKKKERMIDKSEFNIGSDCEDVELAIAFDGSLRICDNEMYYPSIGGYELPGKLGYVLMQFTGLKDKNGKEIYEGDILNFDNQSIMEVIYENHNAGFVGRYYNMDIMFTHILSSYNLIEVIGNIHETPELLKDDVNVATGEGGSK